MKTLRFIGTLLMAIILTTGFSACSGDDEEPQQTNIVGQWIGHHAFYTSVSGMKHTYLYIKFNADGTGELEYEGGTNTSFAYFTYQVSGTTISCTGARGNTSEANVETNFSMKLRIEGDRIKPLERYTQFILTRDGSITTTANGQIVEDKSNLLRGVWVRDDKGTVIELHDDETYDEYILDPPGSITYSVKESGSYSYNSVLNALYVNSQQYSILQLDATHLKIKCDSPDKQFYFTKGTFANVPTLISLTGALTAHMMWIDNNEGGCFLFYQNGDVRYTESGVNIGSHGPATLVADGTYFITSNTLYCSFTDVDWTYSDIYPYIFPGWTAGKAVTKIYTLEINDNYLKITDYNGKTKILYPKY